jgi:DNA-binding beta-propeller fold protein YncE
MALRISNMVGNGTQGYAGDGGRAMSALMDNPFHVDFDSEQRHLYVADCFNYRIRQVDIESGEIITFAGNGTQGYTGDGGPAIEASLDEIYALQVTPNGDVYILQRFNPAIRKVDAATGIITTVAGNGTIGYSGDGGPATEAQMREPNDCVLDGNGGLLIADIQDQRIRRLDLSTGIITTFAGTGEKEHTGDGGKASEAGIFGARAVCVDGNGNVYICEREGGSLRKIDSAGIITLIAGNGEKGYSGDGGPAINVIFNGPKAIRCDSKGNVLIVDTENHAIRRLDVSTGTIDTVAGGHKGAEGDGGDALKAGLARPHGIVTDKDDAMYIADSENHRIRMVK